MVQGSAAPAVHLDAVPVALGWQRSTAVAVGVAAVRVIPEGSEDDFLASRGISHQRAVHVQVTRHLDQCPRIQHERLAGWNIPGGEVPRQAVVPAQGDCRLEPSR